MVTTDLTVTGRGYESAELDDLPRPGPGEVYKGAAYNWRNDVSIGTHSC